MKIISIIFALLSLLYCGKTNAQEIGLSIDPPITVVDVKPGSSFDILYKITNTSDPVNISLSPKQADPTDNYGNIKISEKINNNINISIIDESTDKISFLLNRNTVKEIKAGVRISEDTPEGDYLYSIITTTNPQPAKQGTISSKLSLNVGTILILSVKEKLDSKVRADIVEFKIKERANIFSLPLKTTFVDSNKPFRALLLLQNQGQHTIIPNGSLINIDRNHDRTTYAIVREYILPGWQRVLKTIQFGKVIPSDGESIIIEPKLGKGRLIAAINMPDGTLIQSTIDYIALPFFYIKIITTTVALILIALAYFVTKKR